MKNKIIKTVAVFMLLLAVSQQCFAGFPIGNGRWLLVPTYTRYTATGYWDNGGISNSYNGERFISNYYGLFGGFGIGRDVDVVFNIPFVSNRYISASGADIDIPLQTTGDITVGLSYFINHFDYFKHLSITGSLIFPSYPKIESQLLPGFSSPGGEIKVGLAGTNTEKLKDTYYDMEAGIRTYFNDGGPSQFFANATLGVPLNEDWKMSGTLNGVWSSSSVGYIKPTGFNINKDFSYIRASMAVGRRIDRNITLWASIFRDMSGTSIGQGSGFSIYAVLKF
jgi:protein XagA